MKSLRFCIALALAAPALATAAELRYAERPVPGQYIVVLKSEQVRLAHERSIQPTVATAAASLASSHGLQVAHTYESALPAFVARADARRIQRLLSDPQVAYVEEDGYVSLSATQTGATWGLDRIDQRDRPLNGSYVYNTEAANVRAYIIDTGILANHTDFGGRVQSGFSSISDGRGTSDCNGHGTHVAGTVGSRTYGVAKGVRLVPVRVFGCQGNTTNSAILQGIDWVRANAVRPAVANMSLGGPSSPALDQATSNLIAAGVTVVVAAGNDNSNACNFSPARVANAITVGSTTSTDARSSFSNFGTCVNIWAPGSNILSTWHTGAGATNTISGTSMASPHVAGVAALHLAGNAGASPAQVASALYSNASTNKLSGLNAGSPNRLVYSITGGGDTPVDTPPTASFSFSCQGLSCSFDGSASSDDRGVSSYSWTFGNGSSGSGATPTHSYAAAGTYQVTLTVRDTANQTGSQTRSVSVTTGGGDGGGDVDFVYPDGIGGYQAGVTVVRGSDGNRYRCRPWPNGAWCNIAAPAYAPGSGWAWQDAWTRL